MSPSTHSQTVSDRITHAVDSDLLFELGVMEVMSHFGLSHNEVKEARALATDKWPQERFQQVMKRRSMAAELKRLHTAESEYPHVLRRMALEGLGCTEIASKYGFTKQYASQLANLLRSYARSRGGDVKKVVLGVEKDVHGSVKKAAK